MTPTACGRALALAMLANEALAGRPMRLLWCVDLDRDVGPRAPPRFRCLACDVCHREADPRTGRCVIDVCPGRACDGLVVTTPSGTTCPRGHGNAPWHTPASEDGRGGKWGEILTRLKGALDRHHVYGSTPSPPGTNHRTYDTRFAIVVRESSPEPGGTGFVATYGVPYFVDPSVLAGRPPPVGAWRVWPEPPLPDGTSRSFGRDHVRAGDMPEFRLPVPDTFWHDGIPF